MRTCWSWETTTVRTGRLEVALVVWLALTILAAAQMTRYVVPVNPGAQPPYTNWPTAATNIQDAVDVTNPGDLVLVSNGTYATGGRVVYGSQSNRLVINKAITVRSVNGPANTTIEGGAQTRCAYVGANAVLAGFRLQSGTTRLAGGSLPEQSGGGAWCEESAVLSNCWLIGNTAYGSGGGVYGGTLLNCTVRSNAVIGTGGAGGGAYGAALTNCMVQDNSANYQGGGAHFCRLTSCSLLGNQAPYGAGAYNSRLAWCSVGGNQAGLQGGGVYGGTSSNTHFYGNTAQEGGGAYGAVLKNSVLAGNQATNAGGGTYDCHLYHCTLTHNSARTGGGTYKGSAVNSIVYYNRASRGANTFDGNLQYCCTTPWPPGGENILTNEPDLASHSHLSKDSRCRGAGDPASAEGADIDGEPWLTPPSMGCDEVHAGSATGTILVALEVSSTNAARQFPVFFRAVIHGAVTKSVWDFGDGTTATNRPCLSHAFAGTGVYPVRLTAHNDSFPAGISATVTVHVTSPRIHYVRPSNPGAAAPYTNWATAATTIQNAVDAATQAGAHVLVSNGTYASGGRVVVGALTNRLVVDKPVIVESVGGAAVTIIQGSGPLGNSAVRCAYVGEGARLTGFTLRNGATRTSGDPWAEQSGGGVYLEPGAEVSKCIIRNCSADEYGGGAVGGTLNDCTLSDNRASRGGGAAGGVVKGCVLDGNVADTAGGGAAEAELWDCRLLSNRTDGSGGGAFDADLFRCELKENTAVLGGGAMQCDLYCCDGSGNGAAVGGGLYQSWGYNSAFYGNQAGEGGGAYASMLYNCTVTGNRATNMGGGVCGAYCLGAVVWDNKAGVADDNWSTNVLGEPGGLMFSCAHPLPPGTGNLAMDPCFVAPGSGYGFTHNAGNYRLQSNSPCLNAGTNQPWMTHPSLPGSQDLDGQPRIFGDGRVDMGAYEYQGSVSCAPTNWLAAHDLPIDGSADQEDRDGDGYSTCEEYVADTDPTSRKSYLPGITNLTDPAVLRVSLYPTSTNRVYDLFSSTNLMATPQVWTAHGFNLPGSPTNLLFVITNTEPRKFFRTGVRFP